MANPSITDWITASSTVIAAVAAVGAALYTKRSAREAANAAKAAAEQVELQRPMPIVVATFSRSFSENMKGGPADREFQLQNIGDSTAFDVELSPLETPGALQYLSGASRLTTEKQSYLRPNDAPTVCVHQLEPLRGAMTLVGGAAVFTDDATRFFNHQGMSEQRSLDFRYQIHFVLSYRALDGRRFEQPYVFVVFFPRFLAWVEPVGSLLEAAKART